MPPVPEFILRKLIVKDSLKAQENGFSFAILNSLAPATLLGFALQVDGKTIASEKISLQAGKDAPVGGAEIDTGHPFAMAVGVQVDVRVKDTPLGSGDLYFTIETREAGTLAFGLKGTKMEPAAHSQTTSALQRLGLFKKPLKTEVTLHYDDIIGEIHPYVYGQFVEHLERCVYDGIWTPDGSALRTDTLEWIKALKPPLIRYPGGNFASGYHWEDGIGPKAQRPERFDEAWQSRDSNQVGTDEFLAFCQEIGTDPFLVVNSGNGTPEEAARWVAYCNEPPDGEQGRRRAANGHPEPYHVKLWGIGNEVWGPWQIGHTDAETYTRNLRLFAEAMRAVDPQIELVAVGDKVMSDDPNDPGCKWNETVLRGAGDLIDHLSFHLYQPDREGWQESYHRQTLHHTVCAAPLDAERIIERIAAQIETLTPDRQIGIAFDEWNLWLAPPEDADSMHRVIYTMRDALYVAGMLNVFHRQCGKLKIANLAQLVNVLPLIVTTETQAYVTPLFYPFQLYLQMEPLALNTVVRGKFYDSEGLGNIAALTDVPYVDVSATRNAECSRVVLAIINRHPTSRTFVDIDLKGFPKMKLDDGWVLRNEDELAFNSADQPERVKPRQVSMPAKRGTRFKLDLPQASLSILVLEKE